MFLDDTLVDLENDMLENDKLVDLANKGNIKTYVQFPRTTHNASIKKLTITKKNDLHYKEINNDKEVS